ncbi:MAG: hypothetical protein JXA64_06860 [Candidatus Fermentibacteraceae bacterium]|nr:hypothetical protein [Candidatus Fermentibacteraceae bacterium]MBN2608819.1 hypothetical protein [Candidatus Fermentibacteraceae bacterium]
MKMAVTKGTDYVFAEQMTYNGPDGIGKGCLLGTRSMILQLPVTTMERSGRIMESRDWFIRGIPAGRFVRESLEDPSLDPSDLDGLMRDLASSLKGTDLIDLSTVMRLRVRSSLMSRGIYISVKSSGPGWRGFPLKKDDAGRFMEFYRGHPAAVGG